MKIDSVKGPGKSPLQCSHITSVAIGSICCGKQLLDSYQDTDLKRLQEKWENILKNYNEYAEREATKAIEQGN